MLAVNGVSLKSCKPKSVMLPIMSNFKHYDYYIDWINGNNSSLYQSRMKHIVFAIFNKTPISS